MAYSQYFADRFSFLTSDACTPDVTPPVGGAISSLTNNTDGSLQVGWPTATDPSVPLRYQVFVQAATATGLFSSGNKVFEGPGNAFSVYKDAAGVPITAGTTYFVGVRAVDAVGNVNTNTTSLSIVATGLSFATLTALINAVPGAVWDQLKSAHTIPDSFGDYLDIEVSSRLPTSGYVAPDNASITAIKAKTDNLPADPASNTQVNTRAPASTALDNTVWTNAKAAFIDIAISSRATNGGVWDELTASHTGAGTFGLNAQTPSLNPTQVANAVWDALISAHTVPNSFGLTLQTPLSPTQIANAVWDALTSAHTVAGSFGLNAQNPPLNPTDIASAVWGALITDYNVFGTFGNTVQSGGGGGNGVALTGSLEDTSDTLVGELLDDSANITGIVEG